MKYVILAVLALVACGDDDKVFDVAKLQNPETCKECHNEHYTQWVGSMHAYASDDPVFVAMNKRGQRETNNKLGDFCVRCHAPMAVQLGLTNGTDFDPAALPPEARGVTCYFCHNVDKVMTQHNNGLVLANDQTMRGGTENPVKSPAHHSAYDKLMDSDKNESEMCGSCHDIHVPTEINGVANGVDIERTYGEWQQTFFATEKDPAVHFTCGGCHMASDPNPHVIADAPGLDVPARKSAFHEHLWPGIDQALSDFPEQAAQAAGIMRDLDPALRVIGPFNVVQGRQPGGICLDPDGLKIRIDTIGLGHAWPSGASHDRRAWLEVIATDAAGNVKFSRGVVPDGMDPPDDPALNVAVSPIVNPNPFALWDRALKSDNSKALFFWDIASEQSKLMKLPVVRGEDHSFNIKYVDGALNDPAITKIETRLLIRPLPHETLDALVQSGDLDASVVAKMKTLTVDGGHAVWDKATKGTGPSINTNCNLP